MLQRISESLGLQSNSIIECSCFDSGLQIFAVNMYPPCPQPHLALGLPPHSDHGLLTFLMQNEIGGLQVKHGGKWVNVDPLPNCLVVNIGDQLEVGHSHSQVPTTLAFQIRILDCSFSRSCNCGQMQVDEAAIVVVKLLPRLQNPLSCG